MVNQLKESGSYFTPCATHPLDHASAIVDKTGLSKRVTGL